MLARQVRRALKRSWSVSMRFMFSVMYNLELLLAHVMNHLFGESQIHGRLQEYKSKNTLFLPLRCYSLIQVESFPHFNSASPHCYHRGNCCSSLRYTFGIASLSHVPQPCLKIHFNIIS